MIAYSCGHKSDWCPGHDIQSRGPCYSCKTELIGTEVNFLRCGKPPVGGYSYNYQVGQYESGVSVYLVRDNVILDTVRSEFVDRPWYVGRGVVVGIGGDDEILVDVVTCRKASLKQIKKLV